MQAAVTWWCTSKSASERRGTKLVGAVHCPDWQPARTLAELSRRERRSRHILVVS